MNIYIYIKIIIVIIIIIFICLSYLVTRIRGCKDPNAINYNKNANINDRNSCIYEQKGCMDPKFSNYNSLATVSCEEDCKHCGDYELDKDKIFDDKVDCKYCKELGNPLISGTSCKSSEICQNVVKGCNQPWSYNYNNLSNIDNSNCINPSIFEENLVVLSNDKKAIVTFKGSILLNSNNDGIHILIFNKTSGNFIEKNYFATTSLNNINQLINYLKDISLDKIVVIVSTGETFELFNNFNTKIKGVLDEFEKFGGVEKVFKNTSKYILIGTKTKEIYFEEISEESINYPQIKFIESNCNKNPTTIYPLAEYIFFGDSLEPELMKKMCGLEACKKGYKYFGLEENRCIVMEEKDYNNLRRQKQSNNCLAGIGERGSINSYEIEKVGSKYDQLNQTIGIYVYEGINFTNDELLLNNEYYSTQHHYLNRIKSFRIPNETIVYIEDTKGELHTVVGPQNVRELNDINVYDHDLIIKSLTIKKIKPDSVVLCDTIDREGLKGSKKNKCLIFSPGKHRLPPYLFISARYIKMSPYTKRVVLYNDTNFASEIAVFNKEEKSQSLEGIIDMPRTIRSVSIL